MTDTELAQRIAALSLLRGNFTLRSGRTSTYYLDKYLFSTDPKVLAELGQRFKARIELIESESGQIADRLAGAELGGIPLVAAASLATGKPSLFIRNAKKDYGTAKMLEGRIEAGDRVIFVEDVATTGGQSIEAVGVLKEAGAQVLGVIAVIDRQEGASANFERAGIRFEALFNTRSLGITDEPPSRG